MDFELDEDQRALQESARGIIDKECSLAFVRSVIDDGVDPSGWWQTMVGLYWPALAIEEAHGGLGLTWMELAILLEELGRAVDPSPYLATTSQFASAIRHCGDAGQQAQWLGAVAAGSVTGALALGATTVTATAVDGGWRLDGTAADVVDGARADEIAVIATAPDGVGVFVVDRAAAGAALTADRIPAYDYTQYLANVGLDGVVVGAARRLAGADVAAGVQLAVEEATLGWAITTVGACQRVLELTVDYVKERHQFGVPIGSFQAVKHKAVDMYMQVERARAVAQFAAQCIVEADPRRSIAISMAKAAAGECQQIVFQHGFQLFGGMGFTWENDLQMALRRAKIGIALFGSTQEHRRRVAQEVLVP
jgi:alkylation response protein AidB-like acyl-CoA dehydrogenase